MKNPQTMDKGIRIMGGCVLIGLSFAGGAIDSTGKVVAIIVGLYGLLTGIINFCPLGHFILKEKKVKRKKASAGKKIQVDDVKELYFFEGLNDEETGKILAQCRLKHYPEDQAVIVEGKHKKILFIIYSGEFIEFNERTYNFCNCTPVKYDSSGGSNISDRGRKDC